MLPPIVRSVPLVPVRYVKIPEPKLVEAKEGLFVKNLLAIANDISILVLVCPAILISGKEFAARVL